MTALFNEIFYRPILNLLVFLYDILPSNDLGLAIIGVTLVIRLILYPSFASSMKHQKAIQEIQPKINQVRQQHKDDRQKQTEAILKIYQEHKVSPFSSCLPILIQLPVIFALFLVLNNQLVKSTLEGIYGFIKNPGSLDPIAFGFLDLSKANIPLAILAAGLQYIQSKMMQSQSTATDPMAKAMQTQMLYVFPVLTLIIAWTLPSGLPLYWSVSTLFAIAQQWFIIRQQNRKSVS